MRRRRIEINQGVAECAAARNESLRVELDEALEPRGRPAV